MGSSPTGAIMKWGIWVKMIKHGVSGWMIESKDIALFESKKEADLFIKENTVHKEYYESRQLTKKDIKSA